jgi:type II secretory pathway predicted ATPase ExeA
MSPRFFDLLQSSFKATPGPRSVVLTTQTEEQVAALTCDIQNRWGFVVRAHEVGAGKTTTNCLLQADVVPFPTVERKL